MMRTSIGCFALSLISVLAAFKCLNTKSKIIRGPAAAMFIFFAIASANQIVDNGLIQFPIHILVGLVILLGLVRAYGLRVGRLIAGVAGPMFLLGNGGKLLGQPSFEWARPEIRGTLLAIIVIVASYRSTIKNS